MISTKNILYKVKINELKMLKARKIDISKFEFILSDDFEIDDFVKYFKKIKKSRNNDTFKEALSNTYKLENGSLLFVTYPETLIGKSSVTNNQMSNILKISNNNDLISNVIIISEYKLSQKSSQIIKNQRIKIEHFKYIELLVNPLEHFLSPKYEIIPNDKIEEVLKENNINFKDLPYLPLNDKVSRFLGLEQGQLVKVINNKFFFEFTIEKTIHYRAVVLNSEISKESILTYNEYQDFLRKVL